MPYTTNVAGTTITSSGANANVRDQVVTPFATTSARDSAITVPVKGMVEYITSNDANEGLTTYNSNNVWRLPWNMPWGLQAVAQGWNSAVDQTGITTEVDVTGATVTFTAVNHRYLLLSAQIPFQQNTSAGNIKFIWNIGGSDTNQGIDFQTGSTGSTYSLGANMTYTTAASGSLTIKLRATTDAGTLTVRNNVATGLLLVTDVGPSGAPA